MGSASDTVPEASEDARLAVLCCLAVALQSYQTWLLFNGILPVVGSTFPVGSQIQMAFGVVLELAALMLALRLPHLLSPRPLLWGSLFCCVLGAALLALFPTSSVGLVFGLCLRQMCPLLGFYLLGLMLSVMKDARLMAVCVSVAVLAATCVATFVPAPSYVASVITDALLAVVVISLSWRAARPVLESIASLPGAEVQALASPGSFLLPSHQLYVLMLIFSVAVGLGSTLRFTAFTPLSSWLGIALLACVVVWFLLAPAKRGRRREDVLFCASALLMVAGFLAVPLEGIGVGTANALLYAGRLSFGILSWTALAVLCGRNPAGSMMVLACGELANGVGGFLGMELGYVCNALLVDRPHAVGLVTSVVVLALFAYLLVGLRDFSFGAAIRGVEPAQPLPSPEADSASLDVPLNAACDAVAHECGLTNREREILGMLARGHNGYHVRDELSLSYNTVKTHVSRIYRKLGVHSQQELIDLVESKAEL